MNKTVTIIIPAHNESKNLESTVDNILRLKHDDFILEKILIVEDGSTDNTREVAENICKSNNLVQLMVQKDRLGKMAALAKAYEKIESDIIINADADIEIYDENILSKIVSGFEKDKNTGLVCTFTKAKAPSIPLQKIFYHEEFIWEEIKKSLGSKAIKYRCDGRMYAIKKDIYKTIANLKHAVIEDDIYTFYLTLDKGQKVCFEKEAQVYFKLPTKITDYLRQRIRYRASTIDNYFSKDLIDKYTTIRTKDKLYFFTKALIKSPIKTALVLTIYALSVIYALSYNPTPKWMMATSSK